MLICIPLCYAIPLYCVALLLGIFLLSLIFICVFLRGKKFFKIALCFLLGASIACGSIAVNTLISGSRNVDIQDAYIEGRITDSSLCAPDGSLISSDAAAILLDNISADGNRVAGKCEIYLPERLVQGLKVGDKIAFRGGIRSAKFDFFDTSSVRATRNRIYHRAYLIADNEYLGIQETFSAQSSKATIAEKLRLRLRLVLDSNCKQDTADVLYAMTFGDSKYLGSGIKASFRLTGTAHLLAVSGLHVGVLSAAVIFLLRKLKLRSLSVLTVNTVLLVIYCFLCSFTPSVVRATIMITIALIAEALGLRRDALSSISLAGVILLAACPFALGEVGFQLSFAAVYGIILCSGKLKAAFAKALPKCVASTLAISVSASAGTLPFMLAYFGSLSLSSLLANFLVVPLISLIYPLYLLFAAVCVIIPAAGIILPYVCVPFDAVISVISATASLPLLSFTASIPIAICPLYFAMLLTLSPYFRRGLLKRAACGMVCTIASIVLIVGLISYRPLTSGCDSCQLGGQEYAVISSSHGNYLIASSGLDDAHISDCRAFLSNRGISQIDGIILYDLVSTDASTVQNYSKILHCDKIYIAKGYTCYDNILSDVIVGDCVYEGFSVIYPAEGVIAVRSGDVSVVVAAKGAIIPYWLIGYDTITQ